MEWCPETISRAMETLIRGLKGSSAVTGFYLAGGTGLALQLGHRRSRDLDFFCDVDFDPENVLERGRGLGSSIARTTWESPSRIRWTSPA